jgi:hypothetical protein
VTVPVHLVREDEGVREAGLQPSDDTTGIILDIALAAEKTALDQFLGAVAAYQKEHPTLDGIGAELFARAFATGLMAAAVGMLSDAGVSLSDAEVTLRSVIRSESNMSSGGDA